MDWFRAWSGLSTDPKFLLAMRATGADGAQVLGVWVALMDHACAAKPRGSIEHFDPDTYSAFAGLESARVRAIIAALGPEGALNRPLHDGVRLLAWARRQPSSADNTATERMRRHRAKKKADKAPKPASSPQDVPKDETDGYARNSVTVTGYEAEEKRIFSDASRQDSDFHTPSGNTAHRAQAMTAGEVWQALEAAGIPVSFVARRWNASHVASWTGAGLTHEQLADAITRANAARQRAGDSRPINLGFLEAFVTEVRSGLPPKSTRSPGHERIDAAAQQYLDTR